MKEKRNVLIVEDHPLIIYGYKKSLEQLASENECDFNIEEAQNSDDALAIINKYTGGKTSLDMAFLDIRIPPSRNGLILSGEDLGIKIKELLPETKIIISTTFSNPYRIHNIMVNIDPMALLIKSDLTPDELFKVIPNVIDNIPYYTKTVLQILRKTASSNIILNDIDRRLLYELSIGTMTKDLPEILNLSLGGIERRKRQLRIKFNIEGTRNNDKELLLVAKKIGFI